MIFLALCVFVLGWQYYSNATCEEFDLGSAEFVDESEFEWKLEDFSRLEGDYSVTGWIARLNEDIETEDIYLLIVNSDGSVYKAKTEDVTRTDITSYLNIGYGTDYDYDNSGFKAVIDGKYAEDGSGLYILYCNNGRNEILDVPTEFPE